MREILQAKQFKKSFKRVQSHKDFKQSIFEFVVEELANDRPLDQKYKDHELIGYYAGYRECHLQNDILLVYQKRKDVLVLILSDIGSHSELF